MNHRRLFRLAVGLGLAVVVAIGGQSGAALASSPGPLPACSYGETLTPDHAYRDWASTLLDTNLKLPASYVPPNLEPVSKALISGNGMIRRFVLRDLYDLKYAAWKAGNPIAVASAYRSYDTQKQTFSYWVAKEGYRTALLTSARPGHSEHQLGTTIDFKSKGGAEPWNPVDWATTKAGAWMAANAWKYGWIMSYPKGRRSVTCYAYEPWHYRYFGRTIAAEIHNSQLTERQWLWRHGFGGA